MSDPICRIIKHQSVYGTFYIPQRWIFKKRWFTKSKMEWQSFCIYSSYYTHKRFQELYEHDYGDSIFSNIDTANYYCQEWGGEYQLSPKKLKCGASKMKSLNNEHVTQKISTWRCAIFASIITLLMLLGVMPIYYYFIPLLGSSIAFIIGLAILFVAIPIGWRFAYWLAGKH